MELKKLIASYTAYNHWANETMTRWLRILDQSILYRESASSFPSIDRTLQHMKNAQNFWITIITQGDVSKLDERIKENAVDEVMTDLLSGSKRMIDIFNGFDEEELLHKIPSTDMVQSRFEFMVHVINHNTYHRGQIVTMSRGVGVSENIPSMDYDVFLWGSNRK